MASDQKLSALTRSLILGVSVGTLGLTQVGCAPLGVPAPGAPAEGAVPIRVPAGEEAQLCRRALETRAAADVEALLVRFPQSRCVGPLLGAVPAQTLSALSPASLAAVPEPVLRDLPPQVRAHLPVVQPAAVPAVEARTEAIGRY